MYTVKKIWLGIALAAAAMLAGCSNADESASAPNTPSVTPPSGGGSTPAQITITVDGDEHVTLKAEKTFTADKGKTWHQLKAVAETRPVRRTLRTRQMDAYQCRRTGFNR